MTLSKLEHTTSSEKVIEPHKARILAIAGAVILLHAGLLFLFWPARWPTSYKWLLLPDGASAYFLLAFGLQHSKRVEGEDQGQGSC